jgi:prepilin-type N-terminal cleavage/methylation domain-containing protein
MDRCGTSRGFTLIEVLVSLVILSVSLLAVAGLMATATKNTSFGGRMTEASTFAQDRLEQFRVTTWQSVPVGVGPQVPPDPPDLKTWTGPTGITYTRNWNVVQTGNLKTVTITVNWTDQTNHSVTLVSAISQ